MQFQVMDCGEDKIPTQQTEQNATGTNKIEEAASHLFETDAAGSLHDDAGLVDEFNYFNEFVGETSDEEDDFNGNSDMVYEPTSQLTIRRQICSCPNMKFYEMKDEIETEADASWKQTDNTMEARVSFMITILSKFVVANSKSL